MTDRDPEPLPYDEARAREVVGSYENDVMTLTIGTDGAGLRLEVRDQTGDPCGGGHGTAPGLRAVRLRPAARRRGRVHRHQRRPHHIHAVWELSTLAAEWHQTYNSSHPDLARALEFYDRWLPGTMRRITGITGKCMPRCVMVRGPGDWAARPEYR